jgi:hypothetical protein
VSVVVRTVNESEDCALHEILAVFRRKTGSGIRRVSGTLEEVPQGTSPRGRIHCCTHRTEGRPPRPEEETFGRDRWHGHETVPRPRRK